jgi:uncharacterized protein YukE
MIMPGSRTLPGSAAWTTGLMAAGTVVSVLGCSVDTSLERLVEARRLAADMQVQLTKAGDAANRAVMTGTGDTAVAFARESEQAAQQVQQDADALGALLTALRYGNESHLLQEFAVRFAEYRALDATILGLAVEGTNLAAQRLSFGAAGEAADAFRAALATLVPLDPADRWAVRALAAEAMMGIREIQALQAPHIAEPDDAEMSRLEARMTESAAAARQALQAMEPRVAAQSRTRLAAGAAALDRFMSLNAEIVDLSRRNTNVRSMALSLNQKRMVTAACGDSLRALAEALASRGFAGTR